MKAKSIKGKSPEEIQSALTESMTDGFQTNIWQLYSYLSSRIEPKLLKYLAIKNIDVIGSTSSGEFINGHQSEGEIVILLLDIHKE